MTLYKYTYYMASNKIDIEKLNVKKRKGKYIMKSNNSADYFYSMGITCVYGLDCKTQLNKLIKDDFYTGTVMLYMFSKDLNIYKFIKLVNEYLYDEERKVCKKYDAFYDKYFVNMIFSNIHGAIKFDFSKGETKICV